MSEKIRNKYQVTITDLQVQQKALEKYLTMLSIGRFLLFVSVCFTIYFMVKDFGIVTAISFVVAAGLFLFVISVFNKNEAKSERMSNLILLFKNEIRDFLQEDNIFEHEVNEAQFNNHNYAKDLDILGKHSLFDFVNRTVTFEGRKHLTNWLLEATTKEGINARQEALVELVTKEDFKIDFLLTHFLTTHTNSNTWMTKFKRVKNRKYFRLWQVSSVILLLSSIILSITVSGAFTAAIFVLLFVNMQLGTFYKRKLDINGAMLQRQSKVYLKYKKLIDVVAQIEFQSPLLSSLKESICSNDGGQKELMKLYKLLELWDMRLRPMASVLVNLAFLWEIHVSLKTEDWIDKNFEQVNIWFDNLGEIDALLSLSILHYNHPEWSFPKISNLPFSIYAKEMGHPLIAQNLCVNNDYALEGKASFDFITGANMAGKSTFLKSIGINTALALAGAPVCANVFEISVVKMYTYMKISDSLKDGNSTFKAEIDKIKKVVESSRNEAHGFYLLDELFRGTNPKDRHQGSVKLVETLLKNEAVGLIATHDMDLVALANENPSQLRNFHFDITINDEDFSFDYKVKEGVATKTNAQLLFKQIGLG